MHEEKKDYQTVKTVVWISAFVVETCPRKGHYFCRVILHMLECSLITFGHACLPSDQTKKNSLQFDGVPESEGALQTVVRDKIRYLVDGQNRQITSVVQTQSL